MDLTDTACTCADARNKPHTHIGFDPFVVAKGCNPLRRGKPPLPVDIQKAPGKTAATVVFAGCFSLGLHSLI